MEPGLGADIIPPPIRKRLARSVLFLCISFRTGQPMISIRLISNVSSFRFGIRFFAFCLLRFSSSSSVLIPVHIFLMFTAFTSRFRISYLTDINVSPFLPEVINRASLLFPESPGMPGTLTPGKESSQTFNSEPHFSPEKSLSG